MSLPTRVSLAYQQMEEAFKKIRAKLKDTNVPFQLRVDLWTLYPVFINTYFSLVLS